MMGGGLVGVEPMILGREGDGMGSLRHSVASRVFLDGQLECSSHYKTSSLMLKKVQ